ncbi:hypothetical protein A152_0012595 [Vibrio tasmaniensis 1F-187]|uniref:hypothetical protein n=1 Tax=unclassified Vibrio TaxID=2614977 RepID=UPI0002F60FD7|nr:hypothetical protein [Vibrio tasmaniensis]OEF71859.1 hypothetical protein A152_13615 [Vibrio tasmaniensis 1F-187]
MSFKNRYIINMQSHKAYKLNDIPFKSNALYTRFSHSELNQLPEHAYKLITNDLQPSDVLLVDTLTNPSERALYEVIEL